MEWQIDRSRPICPQITEQICAGISTGVFTPGEKLSSVREISVTTGVNPNTVQKAFEELERAGITYSVRGSGWYVVEDISRAKEQTDILAAAKVKAFFDDMKRLGLSDSEIKKYLEEWNHE